MFALVTKAIISVKQSMIYDLVNYVLVPETALRLVMEDRMCSAIEALDIMKNSRSFGTSMFPAAPARIDEKIQNYVKKIVTMQTKN